MSCTNCSGKFQEGICYANLVIFCSEISETHLMVNLLLIFGTSGGDVGAGFVMVWV